MKKIFAPLKVLSETWIYIFWGIFLLFGLLDIWQGIFSLDKTKIIESIKNGTLSTFSISICIPFFASFLISWLLDKREQHVSQFVTYKSVALIIDIIWIMVVIGLWRGVGKDNIIIQIIICCISILYSFYMYCIECMSNHYDNFKEYDDEYLSKQKSNMHKTQTKAAETKKVGDVEL
ncbi:MAG: hypothetical protein IKN54_01505 [Lachnospiraceae bacterium]|nr:hypothetical protein [Lachnospiraceae bacterium]